MSTADTIRWSMTWVKKFIIVLSDKNNWAVNVVCWIEDFVLVPPSLLRVHQSWCHFLWFDSRVNLFYIARAILMVYANSFPNEGIVGFHHDVSALTTSKCTVPFFNFWILGKFWPNFRDIRKISQKNGYFFRSWEF